MQPIIARATRRAASRRRHAVRSLLLAVLLAPGCAIREPGIRDGAERVRRSEFCADAQVGPIRFITQLVPAPADGGSVWVGGVLGAARFAPDGTRKAHIRFDQLVSHPEPIDVREDGSFRTIDRGGGWSAVGLLDEQGRTLWRYPEEGSSGRAADAMAAGPLGRYGELRFVVGMNGGDGLCVLDADGQETQHIPASNVFSVEVADFDGDGDAEILHTDDPHDALQFRRADGSPERAFAADFSSFSLVRWPERDDPLRVLGIDARTLADFAQVVDAADGRVLATYELPDHGFAEPFGVAVRPAPGAPTDFVIGRTLRATASRSALYVFDAQRKLLYHEVLTEPHFGFAAIPAGADGAQQLLVGVGRTLWRYDIAP